jgi:hypothetical protein
VKPLFTIHAGEFVVGDFIEGSFSGVNLWVPTRDTGIDLLVTDSRNQKTVSLQVKFSRDYSAKHIPPVSQRPLRACGWWALNRQKLADSKADQWVFVLMGFEHRTTDFIVIKPSELLARLDNIHGKGKTIQSYLWVTEEKRCWETRGLNRPEELAIAKGEYTNEVRDFSRYLNDWTAVKALSG